MLVPAKMCCGRGDFAVEYLVICDSDRELAQIQLPGSHAAKVLMERMLALAPAAVVGSPDSTSGKVPNGASGSDLNQIPNGAADSGSDQVPNDTSGNTGENTRRREDNIT